MSFFNSILLYEKACKRTNIYLKYHRFQHDTIHLIRVFSFFFFKKDLKKKKLIWGNFLSFTNKKNLLDVAQSWCFSRVEQFCGWNRVLAYCSTLRALYFFLSCHERLYLVISRVLSWVYLFNPIRDVGRVSENIIKKITLTLEKKLNDKINK
jgi:hypothetical protein